MSPKAVSTSVRGIGVAVITSMSGASPLAVIASRWCTPKRCCSSTIASTRSWKTTASWNSAWVPTTMSIAPDCEAVEDFGALAAFFAAGEDCRASGRRARRAARWWRNAGGPGFRSAPSAPTGRRPRRRAPWRAAPTTVLPEPTSPCSRRSMRSGSARSALISASACSCERGQRIGQRGADLRFDRAVAGQRPAGEPRACVRAPAPARSARPATRHRRAAARRRLPAKRRSGRRDCAAARSASANGGKVWRRVARRRPAIPAGCGSRASAWPMARRSTFADSPAVSG